jgi:hypothetical protein
MSRILRRPMFRRGGEVGEGIMTGIVDRSNYANGTAKERLMKAFEEYPVQGVDPLSQFLIQGGLNLMSATPRGGVLATAAEAFKEPTAGLFKGLGTEQRAKREIALAGEQIDVESDLAKQLARIKNQMKEMYAAEVPEKQFEVRSEQYAESSNPIKASGSTNLAEFEIYDVPKDELYTQLPFQYDTRTKQYEPNWNAIPVGALTFDYKNNVAYRRVDRDTNTIADFIALNQKTLQPLTGE